MQEITLETQKQSDFIDITSKIQEIIPQDMSEGLCVIYVPHTTAGVTINEGADPSVRQDILNVLDRLVPWKQSYYLHMEGNTAAHVKASLVGGSITVLINNGQLKLGSWQKIFFCEFHGPRARKIWVTFMRIGK